MHRTMCTINSMQFQTRITSLWQAVDSNVGEQVMPTSTASATAATQTSASSNNPLIYHQIHCYMLVTTDSIFLPPATTNSSCQRSRRTRTDSRRAFTVAGPIHHQLIVPTFQKDTYRQPSVVPSLWLGRSITKSSCQRSTRTRTDSRRAFTVAGPMT